MFKRIIVGLLLCILLLTSIASLDTHHIEICHEDNCDVCLLIEFAQKIINFTVNKINYLIGFYLFLLILKFKRENSSNDHLTLVLQKVQFNE